MRILVFSCFFLLQLSDLLWIDVPLVSGECLGGLGQCLEEERLLLLQLKERLVFSPNASVKLVTWNESPQNCCSWGGVTWDSNGHVIGLDLSSELISGGLDGSSSLFSLQHLQSLNLANNSFNSSPLPSEFGKLDNLTYLNLSTAGFSGQIPIEISRLRRLVTIDFSILYFPGIPTLRLENPNLRLLVQNLAELRELYLDGVNISAQGEEWCQALSDSVPDLRVLSLSNSHLSGPLDSSLLKLRYLSSIRLDSNNLSVPVPQFFANFSNLTQLRLSSCGLYETFPEKILQVPSLQILYLSGNKLLQGSLPEFPQNGSLQTLVLSWTNFSGAVPDSIGNLKRLTRIELAGCNFTGAIPNPLTGLAQLVYLDLSNNKFSGPVPSFSLSKNLTRVNLSSNNLTGPIPSSHWDGLVNLVTLDLRNNSLNGSLQITLFLLPSLRKIQLSTNRFSGAFSKFSTAPNSVLDTLDLSGNNLEGPIPETIFDLQHLNVLDLSYNKFNGTVELSKFQKLRNLTTLSLSYNNLSIASGAGNPISPLPLNLTALKLASCKLTTLPNISTHSKLTYLDLSDNQINGTIPSWIWKIGNGTLMHLNLSHNSLVELQEPFSILPNLSVLDLHSNRLHGHIPTPPRFSIYVDYSDNQFTSSIVDDIGTYIYFTIFFSLSNNTISGSIPESICNASYMQFLDLSDNSFSGKIPSCLFLGEALTVLNLRRNKFNGSIPGKLAQKCNLQTLDLNGNQLEGKIPQSLANCNELEILNVGNNMINDMFPCWLNNITSMRVLVLRGNNFRGDIECPKSNFTWTKLQIVDLSHNNFSGNLPNKCLSTWTAMMGGENEAESKLKHLQYKVLQFGQVYYQDAVTVTSKGIEIELVKVLTIFTSIDLSCNKFEGEIPEVVGNFTSLYALNLSHNGFTGPIPSSIGNLHQLESLDLSQNRLSGEIPPQLASLTFLSFLNLSWNQLGGKIPTGNQLQTFLETSYEGNEGLCGLPLNRTCAESPPSQDKIFEDKEELDWEFIITGLGFGVGAATVVAPLAFWKKRREWLDELVDGSVALILPIVQLIYINHGSVEAEEAFGIELRNIHGGFEASDEEKDGIEDGSFGVRFCVFCSELDAGKKKAIHDPNCNCHHLSPPIFSSSYSSSSSSTQT